jgi:hypothetical protein
MIHGALFIAFLHALMSFMELYKLLEGASNSKI